MKRFIILSSIFTLALISIFVGSQSTEAQKADGPRGTSILRPTDGSLSSKQTLGSLVSPAGTECTPSGTITIGGPTINGNLAAGDCQFEDGTYFDLYTLTATAGERVVISMSSTAVDAYLILFDSEGEILVEDDDGLGGSNARIPLEDGVLVLPYTGVYFIAANSFEVETGEYQLSATRPAECATNIATTPGSTINSSLGASDCKVNVQGAKYFTKFYSFSGTTGQQLSFTMTGTSGNLDPYMVLRTPSGANSVEDNDGGPGTAARIPVGTGFLTLPETGTYIIEASTAGEFETGNFTLQIGQNCTFSLSPVSPQVIGSAGGPLSVTVTTNPGCGWTATSNAAWITVTAGATGSGNGTVSISVASNAGTTREGTLTIAGQTYTISQSGVPCSYVLSPTSEEVGASSGTGTFSVTAPAGCQWTATSNAGFITTTSSGSGNGTVSYSFSANSGSPRTGTISVADQTFTLTQQSTCPNTVNLGIGNVTGNALSSITIPITASDTSGLNVSAFDFDIRFDPEVLSPANPVVSTTGTMTAGWSITPNIDGGKLLISGFTTGALTGSGTLLNLNFNVIATSATSTELTWSKSQLNEGDPCSTAASGTVTVVQGSLAGTVRYFFGQNPVAVPGVNLAATGSTNVSGVTGSNGTYTLENLGTGAYTLTPTKVGGATTTDISSLDASSVAQFSVQLITLTANQQIAADVSGDGTISSLDASRIAQWVVGLPLPTGDQTGTWKFVPGTRSYTSVTGEITGQDFTAILMGDVTGNWAPTPAISEQNNEVSPAVAAKSIGLGLSESGKINSTWNNSNSSKREEGEIIEIPISVVEVANLLAYDAVIVFDDEVLEPVFERPVSSLGTLSSNFNVVVNRGEPGRIRIGAYGISPVTGDGELLTLRFRVKGQGDPKVEFESLTLNETPIVGVPSKERKVLPRFGKRQQD
jgi:hypothetical protein